MDDEAGQNSLDLGIPELVSKYMTLRGSADEVVAVGAGTAAVEVLVPSPSRVAVTSNV